MLLTERFAYSRQDVVAREVADGLTSGRVERQYNIALRAAFDRWPAKGYSCAILCKPFVPFRLAAGYNQW
jgi:hypothetical protein